MLNRTFDQLTHYARIPFETRCGWALVPTWEALGKEEPAEWSVTDAQGTVYDKGAVLALRRRVASMEQGARTKFYDDWSMRNYGQEFGHYPVLPCFDVVSDMLHLMINQWNSALTEAIHEHLALADDPEANADVRAKARDVRDAVNERMQQAGTNLILTFGVKGKSHAVNGPKLKVFLREPTLLVDIITLMLPLYELMEVKWPERTRMEATIARDLFGLFEHEAQGNRGKGKGRPPAARRGKGKGGGRAAYAAVALGGERADPATPQQPAQGSIPTYTERVITMFFALACLWQHAHQDLGDVKDYRAGQRAELAEEAASLTKDVEKAMTACIGHRHSRSYAHDTLYVRHGQALHATRQALLGIYRGQRARSPRDEGERRSRCGAISVGTHLCTGRCQVMFRTMCSHSNRNVADVLQFMNLHTLKRIAVRDLLVLAKDTQYTARLSGAQFERLKTGRTVKHSDASVEETKRNLAAKGQELGGEAFLDPGAFPSFVVGPNETAERSVSPPPEGTQARKRAAEGSPEKPSPEAPRTGGREEA